MSRLRQGSVNANERHSSLARLLHLNIPVRPSRTRADTLQPRLKASGGEMGRRRKARPAAMSKERLPRVACAGPASSCVCHHVGNRSVNVILKICEPHRK